MKAMRVQHSERKKTCALTIKMTQDEYDAVVRTAAEHKMNISGYGRLMLTMESWAKDNEQLSAALNEEMKKELAAEINEELWVRAKLLDDLLSGLKQSEENIQNLRSLLLPALRSLWNVIGTLGIKP